MDLSDLISNFAKKGFSAKEMVALAGNNIIIRLMNLDLLLSFTNLSKSYLIVYTTKKKASSISVE